MKQEAFNLYKLVNHNYMARVHTYSWIRFEHLNAILVVHRSTTNVKASERRLQHLDETPILREDNRLGSWVVRPQPNYMSGQRVDLGSKRILQLHVFDLAHKPRANIAVNSILRMACRIRLGMRVFFLRRKVLRFVCDRMEILEDQPFFAHWTIVVRIPPKPEAIGAKFMAAYSQYPWTCQ